MDAAQALADLTEISSQIEAAVLFDEKVRFRLRHLRMRRPAPLSQAPRRGCSTRRRLTAR
jgi:hypothetical protein